MRNIFFRKLPSFILFLFLLAIPAMVRADPGDPGCDTLDPTCPIDSGVVFLIIIGATYGIFKIQKALKREASVV